ncbi:ATP-dependent zinc protease [Candidatus Woesearchaeota archaeon]|nr:ATP-dependent zinc protease [Candidatus Woesearchaeota archaeon]
MTDGKTIVGLIEHVRLVGKDNEMKVLARIDTGATKSSIDAKLAAELQVGPEIRTAMVRSAHGVKRRGIVKQKVIIAGRHMNMEFTLADRSHMKYKVLIGQNILKRRFLIDPAKDA